jgi:hypothetical protein
MSAVRLHRPDRHTLVIQPENGYLGTIYDRLYRSEDHPMSLGERVELGGLNVEVTALTDDGRPAEAVFRFTMPLEDPSLRWLVWEDGEFVHWTPPDIGETVSLPAPVPSLL